MFPPEIRPTDHLRLGQPAWFLAIFLSCAALCLVQVLLGGDLPPSAMLAGATFFGLLAVMDAGATTAIGVLNLLLVGRYLLGAYLTKNLLMGEPITANLFAPNVTSEVMLFGFAGVWLATLVVTRIVKPIPLFTIHVDAQKVLTISLVCLFLGGVSSLGLRLAGADGEIHAGGIWGFAKNLASFRVIAIPTLMLYLWRIDSRRWLTHPVVILLTLIMLVLGILTSSKQIMAEPVAAYTLMALARYGWRHPVAWVCIPLALACYHFFVFPIAQYARNEGALYKDPKQAAEAAAGIVVDYLTDPSFRSYLQRLSEDSVHQNEEHQYLNQKLTAYGRFAMIGEADRLISTSDVYKRTEWDTIYTALLVQVPSFIFPRKPLTGSGNFLGRYAGDLDASDLVTQVSYGFMANAYNAFGMAAVLPMSAFASLFFLALLALFTSGPAYANPWSIYAIAAAHQEYVESPFSGLASVVHEPFNVLFVLFVVLAVDWFRRQVGTQMRLGMEPSVVSDWATPFSSMPGQGSSKR